MDNKKKLIITSVVFLVVLVFSVLVFTGVFNKIVSPDGDEASTGEDLVNDLNGDGEVSYEEELKSYETVDYKTHISNPRYTFS